MVINYLITNEAQCADEIGENVLISSIFLRAVTCKKIFGLVLFKLLNK